VLKAKKFCTLLIFLFGLFPCPALFAQSRDIPIYLPAPTGGTAEQRQYFLENFKMELAGAKYPVVDTVDKSMYSLRLIITDNRYSGDAGEEKYVLTVVLVRTKDNTEIVRFEFPFTDLQKMYDWNLFLVYRTMGNAVSYYDETEETPAVEPPAETPPAPRIKPYWFYAGIGVGGDLGYFLHLDSAHLGYGLLMPTGLASVELRFLDFLALEARVKYTVLHEGSRPIRVPSAAGVLKAVLTPGGVMLQPYGGVEYSPPLDGVPIPWLSATGGIQLGIWPVGRGVITLDLSATYSIFGTLRLPDDFDYRLLRFTMLAGYKIGFFPRRIGAR
jgi:hypothetical protein